MKASVVIPSYNACERLYYNLLSLSMQSCAMDSFEAIVIDNCSTDGTWNMLMKFNKLQNMKKLRLNENVGRSKARNIGINAATGDIIIFCDSDMICDKNFILQHIAAHSEPDSVVCGVNWEKIYTYYYKGFTGSLERNFNQNLDKYSLKDTKNIEDKFCLISEQEIIDETYKAYSFTYSEYEYNYRAVAERYGAELSGYNFPWSFFITNNCSASKEKIVKAGMFDEDYKGWGCEDLDLGYRLYKAGGKFKKLDIGSIHQEHPVNNSENGLTNIYYFSEKYNETDILLYYFHDLIPVDSCTANDIITDINKIEDSSKYDMLLDAFKELIMAARDGYFRNRVDKYKRIQKLRELRKLLIDNNTQFERAYKELKEKYDCKRLAAAFAMLAKRIAKVEID